MPWAIAVLGLGVAGRAESSFVGASITDRGRSTAAAIACVGRPDAELGQPVDHRLGGETVCPSRAWRARTKPTSARAAARVVAAHPGHRRARHAVGVGRASRP